MMVVMAFATSMDEERLESLMESEPYVVASITLYMNSNLVASFDVKLPAGEQQTLENYCTHFRHSDLHIRALGWVVSKVCVNSK